MSGLLILEVSNSFVLFCFIKNSTLTSQTDGLENAENEPELVAHRAVFVLSALPVALIVSCSIPLL